MRTTPKSQSSAKRRHREGSASNAPRSLQIRSKDKLKIAADYLQRFPDSGHLTLAKAIYAKHSHLWTSLDAVRTYLRAMTGNQGSQRIGPKDFTRPPRKPGELPPLPDSLYKDWSPFKLNASRILVLSDVHVPYHDTSAVQAALKQADEMNPDCVLLNGDIIDFMGVSKWQTNPAMRDTVGEVERAKQFLFHIRQRYPKARLIYKKGNHEERLDFYIWRKCPELWGLPGLTLSQVLEMDAIGCELISDQRIIETGKLNILHGHEFPRGMSSPVNPARGYFLRGHECMLGGHYHRSSEHTEDTMKGRAVTTWSAGCLCGLHPEYARLNKWNHGFAFVEVESDGNFQVRNIRIRKGRLL